MTEKRKRSSLARKFAKAVAGTVIGAAMLYGGWHLAFYAGRGEKLAANEEKALKGIFGDEINTAKIRKHFREKSSITHVMPSKIGMVVPPFSHIDFFGPAHWSHDYTAESRDEFGLFVHESTHCMQWQSLTFPLHDLGKYEYTLSGNSRFNDFGCEQQADIIEDYAKTWLYTGADTARHTAQDTLLFKVVEARFPRAKKTREDVQRKHVPAWKL